MRQRNIGNAVVPQVELIGLYVLQGSRQIVDIHLLPIQLLYKGLQRTIVLIPQTFRTLLAESGSNLVQNLNLPLVAPKIYHLRALDDILYQHFLYPEALELLKQTVLEILIDLHSKEIEYLPTVFGADGIGQLLYLYLLLHPKLAQVLKKYVRVFYCRIHLFRNRQY